MYNHSSTITSQIALTLGGSLFPGALGSMLIEILPFLRGIASSIHKRLGDDNPNVLPTVMVAYTLTSFLIGVIFIALAVFRCGRLVSLIFTFILSFCEQPAFRLNISLGRFCMVPLVSTSCLSLSFYGQS